MLLFGHIGVTLGIFFGLAILVPRLKTIINPIYLAIGTLLPDLIDKPLGMIIFGSILSTGRMVGHTLLFSLTLLLIGLYLYDKKREIIVLTLATGSFFHLIEDQMWGSPRTLFWPFFGFSFPKYERDNGIEYLLTLFKESFTPHFSRAYIPEILGMVVIILLALHWLKNRLNKHNYKDGKQV